MRDLGQIGALENKFCKSALILLLVFKEFADFKASQLTTDIVLIFDGVKELEAGEGLLDDGSQLEVIDEVHKNIT